MLAKGLAASVSALVFASLVVQAQWGCDSAGEEPPEAAGPAPDAPARAAAPSPAPTVPATASPSAAAPASDPAPAVEVAPTAPPSHSDAQRGAARNAEPKSNRAPERRYFGSTKSDPDMWSRAALIGNGEAEPEVQQNANAAPTETPSS